MLNALSVSKFNNYIKNIFDAEELLHNISIYGEIAGLSESGGIAYFNLKDQFATLPCVCFNIAKFSVKNGDKVLVKGSPNFYAKAGKFNFSVAYIQPYGLGELYQQFVFLKEKLQSEGLFDESKKKPIPKSIKRIGIVTSKEGAVLQDIINVTARRNGTQDLVVMPTKVQGQGAEKDIIKAIQTLDNWNVDVIIIARGGGSFEDLSAFNTEEVARCVAKCKKPVISAVGHETDYTLCDFASDIRAATPSVAGELVSMDLMDTKKFLRNINSRLLMSVQNIISNNYNIYYTYTKELLWQGNTKISAINTKLVNAITKFSNLISATTQNREHGQELLKNKLLALNPTKILETGYARITKNDKIIKSVNNLCRDDDVLIYFSDGNTQARIMR